MTHLLSQPLGLFAQLSCIWEVTARKPGNVHRFKDFDDTAYLDFIVSAAAMANVFNFGEPYRWRVGEQVLYGVKQIRAAVRTNTNLGILLLLVPLWKIPTPPWWKGRLVELREGLNGVLGELTVRDAIDVYEAIRLAGPAGLGRVPDQDVSQPPTQTLRDVMALAAERDLIARQYTNGFQEVFLAGVPSLERGLEATASLEDAIIACHLHLLADYPDSLIARKCGKALAEDASQRAARVLAAGWPHTAQGRAALRELDVWLRADGHRRNPGTTADLVAASLFVALRQGIITLPPQVPWSGSMNLE
jgi:triphosphoribosyl-dephospho-CoA synthase